MTFRGARIQCEDLHFGAVEASIEIVEDATKAEAMLQDIHPPFPAIATILVARDCNGKVRYYGDHTLIRLFEEQPCESIEWYEYSKV
jgi:hypothetical protein